MCKCKGGSSKKSNSLRSIPRNNSKRSQFKLINPKSLINKTVAGAPIKLKAKSNNVILPAGTAIGSGIKIKLPIK